MTNVSKCLAVFAAVASLAFFAVVSLSAVGGPNYEGDLDDPVFSDYAFTRNVDDATGKVTWKAESRLKRGDPGNPNAEFQTKAIGQDEKVLAGLLIKALRDKKQQQSEQLTQLDDQINALKTRIADAKKDEATDRQALESRIQGLNTRIEQARKQLLDLRDATNKKTLEDVKKRNEAERRSQDIKRIRNQIEIVVADRERLVQQKRKLEVLLEEMEGTVRRLRERNRLLKGRLPAAAVGSAAAFALP